MHGRREYIESHGGFKIWGRKSLPSASVGIFGAVFFITDVPVEPKLSRTWDIVEEPNDLPKIRSRDGTARASQESELERAQAWQDFLACGASWTVGTSRMQHARLISAARS